MVMNSMPFQTTSLSDPYYKRLIAKDTTNFWKIFSRSSGFSPSDSFKDLIEKILGRPAETRLNLQQIRDHFWCRGVLLKKIDVKKQMGEKKVLFINQEKKNEKNFLIEEMKIVEKVVKHNCYHFRKKISENFYRIEEKINEKIVKRDRKFNYLKRVFQKSAFSFDKNRKNYSKDDMEINKNQKTYFKDFL